MNWPSSENRDLKLAVGATPLESQTDLRAHVVVTRKTGVGVGATVSTGVGVGPVVAAGVGVGAVSAGVGAVSAGVGVIVGVVVIVY
jgi:hypothetical protein